MPIQTQTEGAPEMIILPFGTITTENYEVTVKRTCNIAYKEYLATLASRVVSIHPLSMKKGIIRVLLDFRAKEKNKNYSN